MKKLGFGAMRLPILDKDQTKIDLVTVQKMVDKYMSEGFNYFDTAYGYHDGFSETAVRDTVVKNYPRESFMLVDKMPLFKITTGEDYEKIFSEQTKRCGVDYFDIYLLHAITKRNYPKVVATDGFYHMKKLKEEGKIKHIGLSFHDTADLLDKILTEHPETEYVQLQINYIDWDCASIQSRKCYEVACRHGKPVIVMEPVKGGALAKLSTDAEKLFKAYNNNASLASWAIRFAASLENTFMVLSGMSNLDQVVENVSYMKNFAPLNDVEKDIVKHVAEIIKGVPAIACTACRYCVEKCPKKIAIPDYFSLYNSKKQIDTWVPAFYYNQFTQTHGKAGDCIGCEECVSLCPQHLNIPKHLKAVSEVFDKPGDDS